MLYNLFPQTDGLICFQLCTLSFKHNAMLSFKATYKVLTVVKGNKSLQRDGQNIDNLYKIKYDKIEGEE